MKLDVCKHCGEQIRWFDVNPALKPWWLHFNSAQRVCFDFMNSAEPATN